MTSVPKKIPPLFIKNLKHLNDCRAIYDNTFHEVNQHAGLEFIPTPKDSETPYHQQGKDGGPVKSLRCLYEAATAVSSKFNILIEEMVSQVGKVICPKFPFAPKPEIRLITLKEEERTEIKVTEGRIIRTSGPRYSWIYDVVRCSVICFTPLQIASCVAWLKTHGEIVKAKNRFVEPSFNGYRDLLLHVKIQDDNETFWHTCEVQIHHNVFWNLGYIQSISVHRYFRRLFSSTSSEFVSDCIQDMNSLFPEGSIVLNQDVLLQLISNCTDPTRLITLAKLFDRYFSDKETAYRLLERALAAQTLALGDFHFDVSITMQIMGQIHWNEGNQQAALDKFDRVYEIQKHKLGYNDIRVALALDDKASIHFSKGRLEEARKLYQRSFVIKRKLFGENHPETAEVCLNLARIFQAQGKFQDASRKSISALNIFQNYLDEDNCLIVDALICLAEVKHSEDYHDMSIETYERALALTKKAHGENNVRVADISYKIALVEKDRGRKSKRTIDLLKNAYHIYFKEYGPRHEKTMVCKRQLQRLYYATASMQGLHTSVPDSLRLSDGERSISSSFSLSSVFSKTSSWFQNKLEY